MLDKLPLPWFACMGNHDSKPAGAAWHRAHDGTATASYTSMDERQRGAVASASSVQSACAAISAVVGGEANEGTDGDEDEGRGWSWHCPGPAFNLEEVALQRLGRPLCHNLIDINFVNTNKYAKADHCKYGLTAESGHSTSKDIKSAAPATPYIEATLDQLLVDKNLIRHKPALVRASLTTFASLASTEQKALKHLIGSTAAAKLRKACHKRWWRRQKHAVEARLQRVKAQGRWAVVIGHHPAEYVSFSFLEHRAPLFR